MQTVRLLLHSRHKMFIDSFIFTVAAFLIVIYLKHVKLTPHPRNRVCPKIGTTSCALYCSSGLQPP